MNSIKIFLLVFIFTISLFAQSEDKTFELRRINQTNLYSLEYPIKSKQKVFPLGYGTNHFEKVDTGTGSWTELNPKVPRVTYIGLHFVNKDTGWACGENGAIIKTVNGGQDWTISETPINNYLLKIHSYDGQVVIVTGWDGIILRSSDAGETFEQVTSGVGNGTDLWGVQMLNDTLGWVSGEDQSLLKTTDAGLTWQFVNAGLNQHYWSLNFLNEHYGMIPCSGGIILKTTDGGNNWNQTQAGDTRALYTIDVIDSLHIAAAGSSGKNVYSNDGGVNWISNPDIPAFTATNWVDFIDADTGYSVQDIYNIRKTTNRGQSWFGLPINMTSEWHIQLLEDGTGYSCGEEAGYLYTLNIFKRTNGLENWSRLFLNDNFADVFFTSEMVGYVAGGSSIGGPVYKTTNAGTSWFAIPNFPIEFFTTTLASLTFTDSLTGFAGGSPCRIVMTTDAGVTWRMVNRTGLADTIGQIRKFFFINSTTGWAVTGRGGILKTIDGGNNWFAQLNAPLSVGFNSIYFVDSLYGWVSGGRPYKTTDGGYNWIQQTNTTIWNSDNVYFTNVDTGWFAKYSSISNSLFKTIDGGTSWVGIPEVIGARKFYFFPEPSHWLIIGFSRYYETTNGGQTWLEFTNDVPTGINSFNAPTNSIGYAMGSGGLVLKYEDSVTNVPTDDDITNPNQFSLQQNYPNPFNPSTTIKYKIPERSFVTVKVYDVLGNEVTTLVNEEKPSGSYEVKFDGSGLPSGIYFYRLQAGSFVETKKMILMK